MFQKTRFKKIKVSNQLENQMNLCKFKKDS